MEDFLVSRMEINSGFIDFNMNLEDKAAFVEVSLSDIPSPFQSAKKASATASRFEYPDSAFKDVSFTLTENPMEEEFDPEDKELPEIPTLSPIKSRVPSIPLPQRDNKHYHTLPPIVDSNNPDTQLLQRAVQTTNDNLLLYDVYYNSENAIGKQAQLDDALSSGKPQNVIKIDVDLKELQSQSVLGGRTSTDLQSLAKEIRQSILVDDQGTVKVNSNKINPSAINLVERNVMVAKPTSKHRRTQSKKILNKTIKFFDKNKYLVIISYKEQQSAVNHLVLENDPNQYLFDEYDITIEVSTVCMSNPNINSIIWDLKLTDAEHITGLDKLEDIAVFLSNNIVVLNNRFMLVTDKKVLERYPSVFLVNHKVIRSLQSWYTNKKYKAFYKNFKKTHNELKQ
jgi:hypothetical protein